MSVIEKALAVLVSDTGLLLRRVFGCRCSFPVISLVEPGANLKTKGKSARIAVGKKCGIRKSTELAATDGQITLADGCFINRNCMIVAHEAISIGSGTTIGPGTYIYDHDHSGDGGYITAPVVIGKNVWIGAGCIILKGVTIGDNSVIAAGAVVTKNVAENEKVAGVPAKVMKTPILNKKIGGGTEKVQ